MEKREKGSARLPWTGERYVPEVEGPIALEHLHRYAVACELASGKLVLDIACGEGYGTAMLAEVAQHVIGVDNSDPVIAHATGKYQRPNLEFKVGNCTKIPIPDGSLDLVVSFETIEHHGQHDEMLMEIKRVLKPAGLLLVSSPNKNEYSVAPNSSNPFHVKELNRSEFESLLGRFFNSVAIYGQRVIYGSGIFSESHSGSAVTFERKESFPNRVPGMSRPQYFLALAADHDLPEFLTSIFEQPLIESEVVGVFEKMVSERDQQIVSLQHNLEGRNQDLDNLNADLADRRKEVVSLQHDLVNRDEELVNLNADLAARKKEVQSLQYDLVGRKKEIKHLQKMLVNQNEELKNLQAITKELEVRLLDEKTWALSLDRELETARRLHAQIHREYLERTEWALSLDRELETARRLHAQIHREYLERTEWALSLNRELTELYNSRKWRLIHPLSTLRQSVKHVCIHSTFCRMVLGGFFQSVFRSLPFSARSRVKSILQGTEVGGAIFRGMKRLAQGLPSQPIPISPTPIRMVPVEGVGELNFRSVDSPKVSIVIPVHNHLEYTVRCLKAIQDSSPQNSFEIIVIDDRSEDQTGAALKSVKGLRVITNDTNQGFIKSCNKGAEMAKGEFLLFLNNDTHVLPHWLDELVETFRLLPKAGLVGAKLLYPDGTLQEAGGIIWNDGSAWNYGRNDDPRKPEYNYLREVDYCSGACIMVPKNLFSRLGGFDEAYAPAYGEDSDLAFKVKETGRKVLYQPMAEVIHFEGISSGTDLTQGIKSFQVANGQKFYQRWHSVLSSHRSAGSNLRFERERRVRKRILVVDACTPTPDQDSGSFKIYNFMRIFQALSYKVTFVPDNLLFIEKYTPALQRIGVECLYWSYIKSLDEFLTTYGRDFDFILTCRPNETEFHLRSYRKHCPRAKIIYDTADLHFIREQRQGKIEGNPGLTKAAKQRERQELGLVSKVDYTLVVSEKEKQILLQKVPGARVAVISAVHDIVETSPKVGSRAGIFFLGGYQHPPNVDAVQHFVKDIYPLIRQRIPGIRFYIIGSRVPESLHKLACEDIVITGYVPDLKEHLNGLRVAVNPLRYGAGIKGKIVTSMAYGLPCVGTSLAFEGMGLADEEDVLIGDTPEQFAQAVARLYRDDDLWGKLSQRGVEIVQANYSFPIAKQGFENLFSELSGL